MACILNDATLTLTGDVGEFYFGDGFTYGDVVLALAEVAADSLLTVHINSGGGYATEGAAIHALLSGRDGTTNIVVDGIAASAASLIAMAGDTVTMTAGAVMMIHDPSGLTFGTSDDHAKTVKGLEALARTYARIYAEKSGKTADECRTIMKAETWFEVDEAIEAGFADATDSGAAQAVAAFDYRAYAHAPKKLTALAKRKNWTLPDADERARMSAPRPSAPKETTMTDKERAEKAEAELATLRVSMSTAGDVAVNADRERRSAIMSLEETKGREALAEHLYTIGSSVEQAKATLAVSAKAAHAPASETPEEIYARRRLNGEGLGGKPDTTMKKGDRSILTAAVDRNNARLKR